MWGANLEGTMANIDPQKILNKSLFTTNCKGLNFEGKDFTGVEVTCANLEETHADLGFRSDDIESHIKKIILQKVRTW